MKHNVITISIILLLAVIPLTAANNFKLIDKWEHGEKIFGRVWRSHIDKDGHIICGFFKVEVTLVIAPKKILKFGPRGQGPGDLIDKRDIFNFGDDIAIIERNDKIKLFKKDKGNYVHKIVKKN